MLPLRQDQPTPLAEIGMRKRGFFGWIFLVIFIAWNVLMVGWFVSYLAIREGTGLAGFFLLIVWAVGSIITGLLAQFTRG